MFHYDMNLGSIVMFTIVAELVNDISCSFCEHNFEFYVYK